MSDEHNLLGSWGTIRDLEQRLRMVEAELAVLKAWHMATQARANYLPGWVIAVIGILVSAISVTASLWATGRTP